MNNLANCYLFLDRPADALTLYSEVLAVRRRVLRPDHPEMLTSMGGLANSYEALNRHAEALKLREELVAAQRRVLPPDHPDTLMSVVNLSASYVTAGRLLDAVKLCEEALPAMRAKLAGHPTTFSCMNNLALSYARLNRHAEAIPLREELLAARGRVLPPDHRDTITDMFALANSYAALNRHAEALKLFEESVAAQRRVLPADHPNTILCMINVAKSYYFLGRYPEALPLIEEVLPKADRPGIPPPLIAIVKVMHFQCRLMLGTVAGWRATAETFEKQSRVDPAGLFTAARYRALTAALQAKEKPPDAAPLAAAEADKAMAWLQRAVAAGFKDAARMKKDPDLDFLRDRADFKKLLADLEAMSPPKKKLAPLPRAKK
jgi:tetratricopeptide (TPR) repeat protein